jgi:hypothetical protein
MGLVPATFFGLTFFGWAILLVALLGSGLIFYISKKRLKLINDERIKGGLPTITWREIWIEVKDYEKRAMTDLLDKLSEDFHEIIVHRDNDTVEIKGNNYNIHDLKYVVKKNGAESIVKSSWNPFRNVVVYNVITP